MTETRVLRGVPNLSIKTSMLLTNNTVQFFSGALLLQQKSLVSQTMAVTIVSKLMAITTYTNDPVTSLINPKKSKTCILLPHDKKIFLILIKYPPFIVAQFNKKNNLFRLEIMYSEPFGCE